MLSRQYRKIYINDYTTVSIYEKYIYITINTCLGVCWTMVLAPWVVLHAEFSACHELVTSVLKHLSPGSLALFLHLGAASLRVPQPANI